MNFYNDIFFDTNKPTRFIVYDFETLTAYAQYQDAIELGAVILDYQNAIILSEKFEEFIKPKNLNLFTQFTIDLTGIKPTNVENSPSAEEVITSFSNFLGNCNPIFVAQNANFDHAILKTHIGNNRHLLEYPCLDLIKLARFVRPGEKSYKLDLLAEYFDVEIIGRRHRALYDSELTAAILIKVLKIFEERNINRLSQIVNLGKINNFIPQHQISLF